jgi:putative membrane protein
MFRRWLLHLIINTIVLMVIAGYMPSIHLSGFSAAIEASLILSILNIFVKPILIILTLPVTLITLGLFMFVINAITLSITAALMGPDFQISGFGAALLASIVMAILNALIQHLIINPIQKNH